jgi:GTPase
MSAETKTRCGSAAVLGLPNAGKSTLVNALVGSKVSIVSPKVQTTRTRVTGIAIRGNAQIILIDTPGIFNPGKTLEKAMVRAAYDAMENVDIIIHLVDATAGSAVAKSRIILDKIPPGSCCFLVLNKVDKIRRASLLELAKTLNEQFDYYATYMISALKGDGAKDLLAGLAEKIPEASWAFDADQITDMPMRLMAVEITREKIFHQLHQELPHAIMVETESWEEFENGSVRICQAVVVQKESHKAIVLGRGGNRIRQIGEAARLELEEIFGRRVHIKLFVKIEEDWSERAENYRSVGLDFPR